MLKGYIILLPNNQLYSDFEC